MNINWDVVHVYILADRNGFTLKAVYMCLSKVILYDISRSSYRADMCRVWY